MQVKAPLDVPCGQPLLDAATVITKMLLSVQVRPFLDFSSQEVLVASLGSGNRKRKTQKQTRKEKDVEF